MKKRIISLIALVVLGLMTAFAQVPTTPLTYQTVVRNAQNQLVINQENVTVTVSVWNGAGTSELYRETHSGLSTNANGLLTLMMGTGTVNLGTWGDIDWSDASIKTTVSYNPGDGTVTIKGAGLNKAQTVKFGTVNGDRFDKSVNGADLAHDGDNILTCKFSSNTSGLTDEELLAAAEAGMLAIAAIGPSGFANPLPVKYQVAG